MNRVVITLSNGTSDLDLEFDLLDISIAQRWIKHLELFIQAGQPWDDARRFYNFPRTEYTHDVVVARIHSLVETIRSHAPDIVPCRLGSSFTQDDLNCLHHVFEVYHGGYDQQRHNQFWLNAPEPVREALADLNIWIHRYETLGGIPRFVATWARKPYRDCFQEQDFQLFGLDEQWGDLRLNYCEIGKSLYDLWHDQDQHILATGFQPHHHYCFDFTVRFDNHDAQHWIDVEQQVWQYFDQHQDFFHAQGYQRHDPRLALGGITIARLRHHGARSDMLEAIGQHQTMKSIGLI